MTKIEMNHKIKDMGCKLTFKPYFKPESDTIMLRTHKPGVIKDGLLKGSEIDVYDDTTFRIWTPQRQKATKYADKHNMRVRVNDSEAELFVPALLADSILPKFGAKIKHKASPECLARLALMRRQAKE